MPAFRSASWWPGWSRTPRSGGECDQPRRDAAGAARRRPAPRAGVLRQQANARRQLGPTNAALFSDFACGASIFGKAAKFRRVVRRAGVDAAQAIAVGDEVRDIEAARAAGIACEAVTWGYADAVAFKAHGPDVVFECINDIPNAILK